MPRWKAALLGTLALGSLIAAAFLKPIPQDPAYHEFADQRSILGIPNFFNVLSNLPFLVAGLFGLCNVFTKDDPDFPARRPWLMLMVSFILTGFGSSYYHWSPGDATLFWDRLPMTIGFGSVLGILLIERVDRTWGLRLWAPILFAGVGSLLWWKGTDDLRFYGLLQGWAIVLVPLMLLLFPARTSGTHYWVLALACYVLAKLLELGDAPIFRLGGITGGHALKHLAAGLASWFLHRHLRVRTPLEIRDAAPGTAA